MLFGKTLWQYNGSARGSLSWCENELPSRSKCTEIFISFSHYSSRVKFGAGGGGVRDTQRTSSTSTLICHNYLFIYFRVSQCHECKMPVQNLAKVFGPTIVGHSMPNIEPIDMLREVKLQPPVLEKLLSMPVDYWNQFLYVGENMRSPPYNPNTHRSDGTPLTPECRPGMTQMEYYFFEGLKKSSEFNFENHSLCICQFSFS